MMWLIIGINILVYAAGFVLCASRGIRDHLIFAFSWCIFTIYHFITPLYFYLNGRSTVWGDEIEYVKVGEDIHAYYDEGMLIYGLANLIFLCGYFFITRPRIEAKVVRYSNSVPLMFWIFMACFGIVLINFTSSGFSILDILRGNAEENLFGATGASNYMKNFADSMVTALIMAFALRMDRRLFLVLLLLSFVIFALMGFRYRIIMTILGILLLVFYQYRGTVNAWWKTVAGVTLVFYFLVFITVNRYPLIQGKFTALEYNPVNFKAGNLLAEQTRGFLDDINIIKYYDTRDEAVHDYGVTFLYFLVRAVPRALVGDLKDSWYPPPAFPIIDKAYNLPPIWAATGEAPLHYAYFYIAGGAAFLWIGAFVVGLILGLIERKLDYRDERHRMILIIIAISLFNWYTRGYFPQFVDNLAFLLIPVFIYYSIIRKYAI